MNTQADMSTKYEIKCELENFHKLRQLIREKKLFQVGSDSVDKKFHKACAEVKDLMLERCKVADRKELLTDIAIGISDYDGSFNFTGWCLYINDSNTEVAAGRYIDTLFEIIDELSAISQFDFDELCGQFYDELTRPALVE
ncbi:MAG: hypothetical protein LR008_01665 [Candidatus Pacebacteria bacterium]|nr:hypothetical protein [Candidatus Paceibacterota bacterium]